LPDSALSAQGDVVTADAPCVRCGYNLRGLPHDGNCPECGIVVCGSLDPNTLRFADRAWLRRLSTGLSLLIAGFVCSSFLAGGVLFLGTFALALGSRGDSVLTLVGLAAGLAACAAFICLVLGSFLLGTPDPARRGWQEELLSRPLTRAFAILTAATALAAVFSIVLYWTRVSRWGVNWLPEVLAGICLPVLLTALFFALIRLMKHLDKRMGVRARGVTEVAAWLAGAVLGSWLLGLLVAVGSSTGAICLTGCGTPLLALILQVTMISECVDLRRGIDRCRSVRDGPDPRAVGSAGNV
jgi:hypothetical protein